ncbi:DUF2929 family protein [Mammaliicoccus stepanovicii]|uniref:Protein of uncharacterized function (DUF2929) n=1 Tax=Mammaliicoccus stepanovicii TaxID=643214 RepID=A0A239ZTS0_9STAP|nr:DUF2929 family protein [Mammaliicoccus stepanovicii]PNZ77533.1 DUF2929 domain-containing protein [Mammaliicoccus stepanovicii]GGI38871.1 hypothetical protein GCM10010896_00550 [Mammaliicoccus stepanovicii]SNV74214.1 Protein of uncharacterised function (DUF2929) [Mammaliicoccus stepanovicii]
MQYIITFIWAFLLSQMINFVLHSLGGSEEPINLVNPTIYSVIITIVVILISLAVGKSSRTKEQQ